NGLLHKGFFGEPPGKRQGWGDRSTIPCRKFRRVGDCSTKICVVFIRVVIAQLYTQVGIAMFMVFLRQTNLKGVGEQHGGYMMFFSKTSPIVQLSVQGNGLPVGAARNILYAGNLIVAVAREVADQVGTRIIVPSSLVDRIIVVIRLTVVRLVVDGQSG